MEVRGLVQVLSKPRLFRPRHIPTQARFAGTSPWLSSQQQLLPRHVKASSSTGCNGRRSSVQSRRYSTEPTAKKEENETTAEVRSQRSAPSALTRLSQSISPGKPARNAQRSGEVADTLQRPTNAASYVSNEFHLYVYSHKHNTHITLTEPQQQDPNKEGRRRQHILISLSTGNLGFRKSARGTYDAAYQLGAYVMSRIQNDGLLARIHRLELVYRGFGQGREAMTKILLGLEGAIIRDRIVRVVDATRVKMGGQRAPKPRRLG